MSYSFQILLTILLSKSMNLKLSDLRSPWYQAYRYSYRNDQVASKSELYTMAPQADKQMLSQMNVEYKTHEGCNIERCFWCKIKLGITSFALLTTSNETST